jgi:hypothetical protein
MAYDKLIYAIIWINFSKYTLSNVYTEDVT